MKQHIDTKLGVSVILVIAMTVGAFVWQWEKKQGDVQFQSPAIPKIKNNYANDGQLNKEIANDNSDKWEELVDEKMGYAVQYPSGYVVKKYDSPCYGEIDNEDGQNVFIQAKDLKNVNGNVGENYVENGIITDLNIFINDPDDKCIRNAYSSIGGPQAQMPKLINSKEVRINGYDVLKRTYSHLDPEGKQTAFLFSTWRFRESNQYYTLMYNNGVEIIDQASQEKTFAKFIDSFTIVRK